MPNWKKVITSGSDASLTSVIATAGFTGSLLGTASYATQALSASYAATASIAVTSLNTSDILIYVKNVTGTSIPKGKVVRINGATGDNALISTASWDSDGVSANTLGILNETIADNAFGYVMTEGKLIGIDTSTFTAGQLLFLGPTGSIIGSEPIPPYHAVRLGQALRIQSNNGSMYIRIDNGYELDELHNVLIISGSDGDLLVASGSNGNGKKLYINSKQLTGSYAITGSLNATSFTGSLFGTASYATQALSASYAPAFPFTGSATILGSLIVKQNSATGSLNTSNRTLQDTRNKTTVDWNNWALYDSQPTSIISVEWYNRTLYSSTGYNSILWDNRILQDSTGVDSSNWENRTLNDDHGAAALSWDVYDKGFTIASNYYYRSEISLNDQGQFVDTPEATTSEPNYAGEVITGYIDDTVTGYDLIYLNTNGVWYPVTQATDQCTKLLGICLVAPTLAGQNPGPILLEGTITVLSTGATYNNSPIVDGLDHGLPIYIANSYGKNMSATAPINSGQYVRVLGHAYQQSATYADYWVMKFRPSNDWITI
jgi:hypothetical protein